MQMPGLCFVIKVRPEAQALADDFAYLLEPELTQSRIPCASAIRLAIPTTIHYQEPSCLTHISSTLAARPEE